MTRRILFVAYHYPPENVIGAARPARFVKYLQRLGYECHVLTSAESVGGNTTRIADPFPGRRKGFGFHAERAVRKLLLPGAIGFQWANEAYRAGSEFISKHTADPITIFSTYPPLGVHLAARRLARETKRPWIADFRDPMRHNPANARYGLWTRTTYRLIEQRIVTSAGAILANTDTAQQLFQCDYPEHAAKVHLLWNGFDPEERISALPVPPRPSRLYVHTGELYQGRSIRPLLDSLKRLIDQGRIGAGDVRLQLIGPVEPECMPDAAFLNAAESAGWLSITPHQVPKRDASTAAQTADGLVLVQPQSVVQVPAKLYDYIQIGRPILAYLPRDSAAERLLSRAGIPYRSVYPHLTPQEFDRTLLEYLSLPSDPVPPSAWFEDTFNGARQTEFLASIIEKIDVSG